MSGAQVRLQPRVAQMRPTQRLDLIDQLGRELQSRYTFSQIEEFLAACGIKAPIGYSWPNSKWAYAKLALKDISDQILLEIADELQIKPSVAGSTLTLPPRNWQSTVEFRLFISHISRDKDKATRLRTCLAPYAITGFVAHEDIHPTLEWQVEIERALRNMDAFIAIHTKGFSESTWTQQEIGFAVARDVKIISLRMGEDPTGFISKQQGLSRRNRKAEEIAKEVDVILSEDVRTGTKLLAAKKSKSGPAWDEEIPF
jgi:TIR domain